MHFYTYEINIILLYLSENDIKMQGFKYYTSVVLYKHCLNLNCKINLRSSFGSFYSNFSKSYFRTVGSSPRSFGTLYKLVADDSNSDSEEWNNEQDRQVLEYD